MSVLLPALRKAREAGNTVTCMSNLRQLGNGFLMYTNQYHGFLPWTGSGDGDKPSKPIGPWNDPFYWVNAVPPLVNGRSYYEIQQRDAQGIQALGVSGDKNLFVCPSAGDPVPGTSADVVQNGAFMMWGNPEGSWPQYKTPVPPGSILSPDQRRVYWCYVINSKLDNSHPVLKLAQIKHSTEVALLVEKGVAPADTTRLPGQDLNRGKTTWTRFTTRHSGGGYILFVDGHVGYFRNADLAAPGGSAPFSNPAYNLMNKVIWDPFQDPLYGS